MDKDNKLYGILSYISILCLVPIFLKEKTTFVKFHVNQGIMLLIAEGILAVILTIILEVTFALSWQAYFYIDLFRWLLLIFFIVISVIGIVKVTKNETEELPFIGNFAEKHRIVKQ